MVIEAIKRYFKHIKFIWNYRKGLYWVRLKFNDSSSKVIKEIEVLSVFNYNTQNQYTLGRVDKVSYRVLDYKSIFTFFCKDPFFITYSVELDI